MLYTPMSIKALRIMCKAHEGQVDKNNLPYILHPFHVAFEMEDELSTTVALLHDVVEDSSITIEELAMQFPPEVIDALQLLTHDKSIEYDEYIAKIKKNEIARKVKIADLMHNSNLSRLDEITKEDIKRCEKYKKALATLLQ